jgi:hypothetical protein
VFLTGAIYEIGPNHVTSRASPNFSKGLMIHNRHDFDMVRARAKEHIIIGTPMLGTNAQIIFIFPDYKFFEVF